MQIELSQEEVVAVQMLVYNGRFQSVDEAVHAALRNLAEEHESWLTYARASIKAGLEDVAAGRVTDGEEVMRRLRNRATRTAA